MKTLLSGYRPTVPAASSSRTSQMMNMSLSSCHKETLILHLLHQQHCHLLTLLYSARYRCTTEFASFATLTDSAYVDCTRWLLSPKTTSKIKRLFSELPTLSQYNTLTLYDGSDIYKSVQSQLKTLSLYAVSHISKSFPLQFSLSYFQKKLYNKN